MDDEIEAMIDEIEAMIEEVGRKRVLANQARAAMEDAEEKVRIAMAAAEAAKNKLDAMIQRKINDAVRR